MTENADHQRDPFLYEAALALSAKLSTDDVLQCLNDLVDEFLLPEAASVASVRPDGSLIFRAASGRNAAQIVGMEMARGSGIVGWVAEHGEAVWVPNVYDDQRFYRGTDKKTGFRTTAILAVPIKWEGTVLAVVEVINPAPGTDVRDAQEMLTILAGLAAQALQNAQRFKAANRSTVRYRSLFDQSLAASVVFDQDGHVLETNRAAQALLAIQPEAPTDVDLGQLALASEQFAIRKEKVADEGMDTWRHAIQTAEAETRVLEMRLTNLSDYVLDGAYQCLVRDVTAQVALDDMHEQLSSRMAHDLRVPLGNIVNAMDMVLTAWREDDHTIPVEDVLSIGLRSAQRMSLLISNIRDIERLTANPTLVTSTVYLLDMITEIVVAIRPVAERHNQVLRRRIPDDLPALQADADRLRRVLINIIDNAIQHTPDGGTITLSIHADEREFLFSVSDTGPGISAEAQARLFKAFSPGPGHKLDKTGLGLAFCKLAVEAHGGEIGVQSGNGQGTVFYFTIPRQRPADIMTTEV